MSDIFVTSWTAAHQGFLSFSTITWSLFKLMSSELVMLSNHLIFCRPLLLLPSAIPSVRVFFNELALPIKWPKYWSFSFSTSRCLEIEHAFLSQDLQMGNWSPGCCEYIREGFHHWTLTEHRSHPVLVIIKEYLLTTKLLTTEK